MPPATERFIWSLRITSRSLVGKMWGPPRHKTKWVSYSWLNFHVAKVLSIIEKHFTDTRDEPFSTLKWTDKRWATSKIKHYYRNFPIYFTPWFLCINSGHWTMMSSTKYHKRLAERLSVFTRHILSTNMILVLGHRLTNERILETITTGTQVPGPLTKITSGWQRYKIGKHLRMA